MYREYDLRFRRDEYLPIPSSDSVKAINDFVGQISFNPSRNRRITAPPFLELDLDSGAQSTQNSKVTYFFMEADVRKELLCTFMDQPMVYTEIDGGEAWGRRRQLSMIITEKFRDTNKHVTAAIEGMLQKAQE